MRNLHIQWDAPCALEFVTRLFLLTSSLAIVNRVLHGIPRRGSRTLSQYIANPSRPSRNEQLQVVVRSVKYEEREVGCKHSTVARREARACEQQTANKFNGVSSLPREPDSTWNIFFKSLAPKIRLYPASCAQKDHPLAHLNTCILALPLPRRAVIMILKPHIC